MLFTYSGSNIHTVRYNCVNNRWIISVCIYQNPQKTGDNIYRKIAGLEKCRGDFMSENTQGFIEETIETADAACNAEQGENVDAVKDEKEYSDLKNISELSVKMDALLELFKNKIETDTYKNRLFDEMHKQLMKYQDDVLQSVMEPVILEIISLLDGIKKYECFIPEEVTAENYGKLKKRFTDIRGDLEDLLEDMDVSKYETDDTVLDAKRQKIIKTVLTDDTAKNNTIESKLSDGYIFKNKIIKYEKVSVYKIK